MQTLHMKHVRIRQCHSSLCLVIIESNSRAVDHAIGIGPFVVNGLGVTACHRSGLIFIYDDKLVIKRKDCANVVRLIVN